MTATETAPGLPDASIVMLDHLQALRDRAYGALQASYQRCTGLREAVTAAERELDDLKRHYERETLVRRSSSFIAPGVEAVVTETDRARVDAAEARLAAARARLARATEAHAPLETAFTSAAGIAEACERYAEANPSCPAAAAPRIGRLSVEDARAEVERVRAETKAARRSRLPADEVRRNIEAQVDRLRRPDLSAATVGGNIRWPMIQMMHPLAPQVDALAVLAFVDRERLVSALAAEAEALAAMDDRPVILSAERRSTFASLAARLLDAERAEEAAVARSEAAGVSVQRRPDADPRAVLGIEGPEPDSI